MDKTTEKQSHLCVLIHGLWGSPKHLNYLSTSLRKQYSEDELHILLPKTNAGNFTYDGIEVGGERVTKEIEEELERLEKEGVSITKLSVIGYSLGGLVARYTIGILYHKGVFDRIEPVNFTTFATPHLGVRSPVVGPHNHIWNILGSRTLSMSGRQLFLTDSFRDTKRPLLSVLADPESVFIRALSEFKNRSLYSNIINDRSAVFYTTYISATDPYVDLSKVSINYLDRYSPVLIDASNPVSPVPASSTSNSWFSSVAFQSYLRRAQLGLLLTIFVPIGSVLFLVNAGIQSVRSQQRIRLHASGKAGIVPSTYHMPLMMQSAQRTAETVFENFNSAHAQEYLEDSRDYEESDGQLDTDGNTSGVNTPLMSTSTNAASKSASNGAGKTPSSAMTTGTATNGNGHIGRVASKSRVGEMEFPTLALTDEQFGMIDALDKVGFNKYPVHIHDVSHTHAAIIVRIKREAFREGKIVIGHWLENFEI